MPKAVAISTLPGQVHLQLALIVRYNISETQNEVESRLCQARRQRVQEASVFAPEDAMLICRRANVCLNEQGRTRKTLLAAPQDHHA